VPAAAAPLNTLTAPLLPPVELPECTDTSPLELPSTEAKVAEPAGPLTTDTGPSPPDTLTPPSVPPDSDSPSATARTSADADRDVTS
jgi:hypothetical protein